MRSPKRSWKFSPINPLTPEPAKISRLQMHCYSWTSKNQPKNLSLFTTSFPSPNKGHTLTKYFFIVIEILTNHIAVPTHNKGLPVRHRGMQILSSMMQTWCKHGHSHKQKGNLSALSLIGKNHKVDYRLGVDKEKKLPLWKKFALSTKKWRDE